MSSIFLIARKELKQFFISPVAYVIALVIFLVIGILFYASLLAGMSQQIAPTIQVIIGPFTTILLFSTPAITMRSLAEESKTGTLETLLTAPVRDWEIVVGKWLGGMFFILIVLAVTWIYPLILNNIISPGIDQGLLMANYLGMILLTGSFLAIGVAASSLFSNQIAAFFATLGVLLVMWIIGYPASVMGASAAEILRYLDLSGHFYNTFYIGVIDLKDVVYFLSVIILSLVLGSVSVEARRWR
jgi:ABC-2 type transport system permease protein